MMPSIAMPNVGEGVTEGTVTKWLKREGDAVALDDVARAKPDRLVISPGPGRPEDAGVTMEVVRRFGEHTPILGVCLGHQAIGAVFGGSVVRAAAPMHGKTSTIEHDGRGVFRGITGPFVASRYHSLVVSDDGLPSDLIVSARPSSLSCRMMNGWNSSSAIFLGRPHWCSRSSGPTTMTDRAE
jgi:anthranilate synthase/aminodeoxychorismate synthase-like glutamine amidotransferase